MFFGLRVVARASVEVAETKVAVGDEGTHAEFLAERQRLTIVVRTLRGIWMVGLHLDFSE